MTTPFKELIEKLPKQTQKEIKERTNELLEEMELQKLRQERGVSQAELAEILETKQANVSRLERRSDVLLSTLYNYVEALGGTLRIVACFPEGEVLINQFDSTL